MDGESETDRVVRERMAQYPRRAQVLRQIHSNKGARAQRWGRYYLIATVMIASAVSVIGFMGTERLAETLEFLGNVSTDSVETAYSLAVLAILVLTILGLIYRFDERRNRHYRSIEVLTEFIRDIEDAVELSAGDVSRLTLNDLDATRQRYKGILATLPPSTDREYVKAKRTAREKAERANVADGSAERIADWDDAGATQSVEPDLAGRLADLMGEPARRAALQIVRDELGQDAWITGGFVRESAWDELHGYVLPTPPEDLDVIYFDPKDISKRAEAELSARLQSASPNIEWSVKNQARMHVVSNDRPYASLEEAVRRFPETATSIACRLGDDGRIKILAPHGLRDLFGLVVRPTPGFDAERYKRRITEKHWAAKWPELHFQTLPAEPGPAPSSTPTLWKTATSHIRSWWRTRRFYPR